MRRNRDNRNQGQNNRERRSRPNPDDRSNNVERIQRNIDWTIHNIEMAEEMIAETSDEKMKRALTEKNKRRRRALEGMRKEIRDEALARQGEDD